MHPEQVDRLMLAVQHLSTAQALEDVQAVVRTAARDLAECDGATFVFRDGEQCYYADEDALEPLWKGSRFPLTACISGWAMLNKSQVAIPDIYVDDRIPHEAYRPTFVKSLLMTPVRAIDPIAAIGTYWATQHAATDTQISLLQALANATSVALDKIAVRDELASEIRMHEETRRASTTDDLTGLLNRRGFFDHARAAWPSDGGTSSIAFIDVDGLKHVNDLEGHDAGDRLIRMMAHRLRAHLREDDVIARLGGDEFAVFSPGLASARLQQRLGPLLTQASVGTADVSDVDLLPDALLTADAAMYAEKRSRLSQRSA